VFFKSPEELLVLFFFVFKKFSKNLNTSHFFSWRVLKNIAAAAVAAEENYPIRQKYHLKMKYMYSYMSIYECSACNFSTKNKALFFRHEATLKHKGNVFPDLKEELSRLKRDEFESKQKMKAEAAELKRCLREEESVLKQKQREEETEMKRSLREEEDRVKYETKVKEATLKEKLKELKQDLKNSAEEPEESSDFVKLSAIEKSCSLTRFMENVINRQDEDTAHNIHNEVMTVNEALMKHVAEEYETNKSIVLTPTTFYYKNDGGLWDYPVVGIVQGPVKQIKKLPELYHKYLKIGFPEYTIPDFQEMDDFISFFIKKGVISQ
jgi:hypothetical protein